MTEYLENVREGEEVKGTLIEGQCEKMKDRIERRGSKRQIRKRDE